jgi:hypothetical protein
MGEHPIPASILNGWLVEPASGEAIIEKFVSVSTVFTLRFYTLVI